MLAIARGLMSDPTILIIDEMSLGLAPVLTYQLFKTLKKLREAGLTILLVEQNVHLALGGERLRLRHRRGPGLHRRSAVRARSKARNPACVSWAMTGLRWRDLRAAAFERGSGCFRAASAAELETYGNC